MCGEIIILRFTENGYWYRYPRKKNKDGSDAKRQGWICSHDFFEENPVTNLNTCEICGKVSTPKKISLRSEYGWNLPHRWFTGRYFPGKYDVEAMPGMLCMGCWNKVRAIRKREIDAYEIKLLSSKLEREYQKWQRSQRLASLESSCAEQSTA